MLSILGVGASRPANIITTEFLKEISVNLTPTEQLFLDRTGVKSRLSSLSQEYLRATHNKDPVRGLKEATDTPTSLGLNAVKIALERAGITAEQLGLVIGESVSPHQSTPSEGQRIAGELNLKVPCYDMTVGCAALPLYVETLLNWIPERLPDYILCVSSNAPTQRVDYSTSPLAAYILGDAAGAVIFSTRVPGKLQILSSYLKREREARPILHIGSETKIDLTAAMSSIELQSLITAMIKRCNEGQPASTQSYILGPDLFLPDLLSACKSMNIDESAVLSAVASNGYSVGSSVMVALADCWDNLKAEDRLLLVHAGDGLWSGSVMMAHAAGGK